MVGLPYQQQSKATATLAQPSLIRYSIRYTELSSHSVGILFYGLSVSQIQPNFLLQSLSLSNSKLHLESKDFIGPAAAIMASTAGVSEDQSRLLEEALGVVRQQSHMMRRCLETPGKLMDALKCG